MAFTEHDHQNIIVKINNRTLNQVSSKTVLGIIIDENLHFKQQAQHAANKAMASLGRSSAFLADIRGGSTEVSLKLTKCMCTTTFGIQLPSMVCDNVWSHNKTREST